MSDPINASLYLKDGTLKGYVRVKITHWTGSVCTFPIEALDEHNNDTLLSQSGIYLLLGKNDHGQTTVYVGKSIRRRNGNSFKQRLREHTHDHLRGKWTKAVCVTNAESNGNRDLDFNYLEFRCYELVKQAGLIVLNRQVPSQGDPSLETRENIEIFIRKVRLIFAMLGLPILAASHTVVPAVPVSSVEQPVQDVPASAQFQLMYKEAKAFARKTESGQYVLLSGSHVVQETMSSCPQSVVRQREEARGTGDLREDGLLVNDRTFDSASGAAVFVCGASVNGVKMWREIHPLGAQ